MQLRPPWHVDVHRDFLSGNVQRDFLSGNFNFYFRNVLMWLITCPLPDLML